MICVVWDVQHIFDPFATIRNLDFLPIRIRVLKSTMPVQAETQQTAIEVVLQGAIANHEAGVQQTRAHLLGCRFGVLARCALHKGNSLPLRINNFEMLSTVCVFEDFASTDPMRNNVAAHSFGVSGGESDLSKKI